MNSPRAIWMWRVAGLALALMTGMAIRHLTAPASSRLPNQTPAPLTAPQNSEAPQTSSQGVVAPNSSPIVTHHASRITDPTPTLTQTSSSITDLDVVYSLARSEPGHALELASALPAGQNRTDLITYISTEWAAKSPEAAALWANELADPFLREQVIVGVVAAWGETDPAAAADWAMHALGPGKPRDDAVVSVVQRWTQQNPEAAAAWVTTFPEGSLRVTAVQELVKLWTDQNLVDASKWVGSLTLSPIRDTAVGAYVNKIVFQYPESAAHWAKEIQDDSLRAREMETVGETWLTADPPAARSWIAQAPLPEPTKARLLAMGL
jgi:hypothetical protein